MGGGLAVSAFSAPSPALTLLPAVQVTGEGVFLSQVLATNDSPPLPRLKLADAPAFRQALFLTRDQIQNAMRAALPDVAANPVRWTGSDRIHVSRRFRHLDRDEVTAALTALLQNDYVKDHGRLELALTRPWLPVPVPDEPLDFRVREMPATGVNAFFIARFEILAGDELVGAWQTPVQAKVWRPIWVARSGSRRGQILAEADVVQEQRDVLTLREPPLSLHRLDPGLELAENVIAGAPLYERSVRVRPVMRRGQIVEAQLLDGVILISLKVELLEDGAPGQLVRVRNMQTKREFRGKVHDANTVYVLL